MRLDYNYTIYMQVDDDATRYEQEEWNELREGHACNGTVERWSGPEGDVAINASTGVGGCKSGTLGKKYRWQ